MNLAFFIEFSTIDVDKDFSVKNLTTTGRWDVVCRTIMATKMVSEYGIPTKFVGIFTNSVSPKTLQILPDEWDCWPSTEQGIAKQLQRLISSPESSPLGRMMSSGLITPVTSLIETTQPLLMLSESGDPIDRLLGNLPPASTLQILLGSQEGFGPLSLQLLANTPYHAVSLGPRSYLSSQCIALIGYLLLNIL